MLCVSTQTSLCVRVNMIEPDDGQSLSQPDRPKPRRHNAKRLQFHKRQGIIYALANDESIASITREFVVSRHTVLTVRKQYAREIAAARGRIAAVIELSCYQLAHEAMEKIGRQIQVESSPLRLLKIYDKLTDRAAMLHTPVPTRTPEPFELKYGKFRRAKQNERCSLPSA